MIDYFAFGNALRQDSYNKVLPTINGFNLIPTDHIYITL